MSSRIIHSKLFRLTFLCTSPRTFKCPQINEWGGPGYRRQLQSWSIAHIFRPGFPVLSESNEGMSDPEKQRDQWYQPRFLDPKPSPNEQRADECCAHQRSSYLVQHPESTSGGTEGGFNLTTAGKPGHGPFVACIPTAAIRRLDQITESPTRQDTDGWLYFECQIK